MKLLSTALAVVFFASLAFGQQAPVSSESGGRATPAGSNLSQQYNNGGALGGATLGTNQGTYQVGRVNTVQGTATAPLDLQVGDVAGSGIISGATSSYPVAYTDVIGGNVMHDFAASVAVTITIPTPATLNNAAPIFVYSNYSAFTDTVSPTTYQISRGGAAAAASITVDPDYSCKIQLDHVNASTWKADCHLMSNGSNFNPSLLGSALAGNGTTTGTGIPTCMVDGRKNKKLQDCVEYFTSQSLSSGVIYDGVPELFATNPFPTSFAGTVWLGAGNSGTTCDSTHIVCWVFEYPLVLPAGVDVRGVASVTAANNFATGTALTFGSNWKAALGAPAQPTLTCVNSGGTIANGTTVWVQVEWVNNLQTYTGSASSTATPGYSHLPPN
jgi:hypothetical protein